VSATTFLRPIHAWFGFWDAIAGPAARIVAIVTGAAVTAVLLVALGVHPIVAAGGAIAAWIGLAIAQEHDGRVRLAPDPAFSASLARAVSGPTLRLIVREASGPPRCRPDEPEVFVLGADDDRDEAHPFAGWYVEVRRDRNGRPMRLSADLDEGRSDRATWRSWDADDGDAGSALADADAIASELASRLA
jgi:hypothetical protein